ncbi:hypothetical protein NKG05_14320 [Oerskovia sp. M15]
MILFGSVALGLVVMLVGAWMWATGVRDGARLRTWLLAASRRRPRARGSSSRARRVRPGSRSTRSRCSSRGRSFP